jgi:hypothetical protein
MSYSGIQNLLLAEFPELQEGVQRVFGSYYDRKKKGEAGRTTFLSDRKFETDSACARGERADTRGLVASDGGGCPVYRAFLGDRVGQDAPDRG